MDDERYRQINIRQILSHTSGMPDMEETEYVELVSCPEYDDGAAERYVRGLRDRKMIANPGERFSYSNIAYNVLGDMLAKVSVKSFEEVMRENILFPSGMQADQSPDGSDTALDGLVIVSFVVPADFNSASLAILYWNGSDWVDLKEAAFDDGRVVFNGGYLTGNGHFEALTNFSGTFALVSK